VTSVAFDPWRCDERNYRFGSVGEDCRLLLWDFSVGMLHRPRAASVRQRASISSALPGMRHRAESSTTMLRSTSNLSGKSMDDDNVIHPVEPRARTAILPPVMAKSIDEHPLCWLAFEEDCIITSCKEGTFSNFLGQICTKILSIEISTCTTFGALGSSKRRDPHVSVTSSSAQEPVSRTL
jgi:hypothetical protein